MSSVKQFVREAQEAEFYRLYPKSLSEQFAEKDAEITEQINYYTEVNNGQWRS